MPLADKRFKWGDIAVSVFFSVTGVLVSIQYKEMWCSVVLFLCRQLVCLLLCLLSVEKSQTGKS